MKSFIHCHHFLVGVSMSPYEQVMLLVSLEKIRLQQPMLQHFLAQRIDGLYSGRKDFKQQIMSIRLVSSASLWSSLIVVESAFVSI